MIFIDNYKKTDRRQMLQAQLTDLQATKNKHINHSTQVCLLPSMNALSLSKGSNIIFLYFSGLGSQSISSTITLKFLWLTISFAQLVHCDI